MAKKKDNEEQRQRERIILRQTKRYLKVNLTEKEVLVCGRELAREQDQLVKIERDKAASTKAYGEAVGEVRGRIARLTYAVNNGVTDRDVECEEIAELDQRRVVTVRLDTGEQVDERMMTDAERQLSFPRDEQHQEPTEKPGSDPVFVADDDGQTQ